MKIKLSKSQWETIGRNSGWIKTAQNKDNRQKVLQSAQFVLSIIKTAFSQNPKDGLELRRLIFSTAKQQGVLDVDTIKLPKNLSLDQEIEIRIFPQSADGITNAEVQGNTLRIYTNVIMENPKYAIQELYGRLVHEFAHLFEEEGTSPDEDNKNSGERTVRYLTNSGEMNSHAWQIAIIYNQLFPNQPFDNSKLNQLIQQYVSNGEIQIYLVKFAMPEIQQKYSHIIDLKSVYQSMIRKIEGYITYIIQQNQQSTPQPQNPPTQQNNQTQISQVPKVGFITNYIGKLS